MISLQCISRRYTAIVPKPFGNDPLASRLANLMEASTATTIRNAVVEWGGRNSPVMLTFDAVGMLPELQVSAIVEAAVERLQPVAGAPSATDLQRKASALQYAVQHAMDHGNPISIAGQVLNASEARALHHALAFAVVELKATGNPA